MSDLIITISGKQAIIIPEEARQVCENWTRVMGYYRPVQEFNIGKKSEHRERKFFSERRIFGEKKGTER